MNKAFIREPDDDGRRHCPACGSLGEAVGSAILERYLRPERRGLLGATGHFCPYPTCEVAYFDDFERVARLEDLACAVYPKDPDAPLCACYGLRTADIDLDLAEGGVSRVKEHLAKAKSSEARCSELAANGRSCVADVQRYFMKAKGA